MLVTGRLTKTTGALTGVAGATITVKVTRTGSTITTVVGSGRTLADGTYAVVVPLKVSGAMSVVYAGVAGLPADSVSLGAVTAGTWSPSLSRPAPGRPRGHRWLSGRAKAARARRWHSSTRDRHQRG